MPSAHWSPVLRYLRRIAAPNQVGQTSDRVLLDRFVRTRDEEAFAALVKRHAAMVLAVCRRVLPEMHDIRSPTRGVVKGILKRPGEGVRNLETVFQIQPDE